MYVCIGFPGEPSGKEHTFSVYVCVCVCVCIHIHFAVYPKVIQHCKSTVFQLKK